MRAQEAEPEETKLGPKRLNKKALKGTLYLNKTLILVLYDTSASMLIISSKLVKEMNLEVSTLF